MAPWHLKFLVEAGESELRFRHMFYTFQADLAVERVEVSSDIAEPETQTLVVFFKEGFSRPENRRLQHCLSIYGTNPIVRKSFFDRLIEDKFQD